MAASACSSSLALRLVVMVCAATGAFAATHVVGDDRQWTLPRSASAYTDWASRQTFVVGDSLVFNFQTGIHDVLQVTRSNYNACNIQNPIASNTTGPATVNLDRSGTYYFICGVGTHCQLGQKMTLTVSPATSTPTSPSPPPTSGGPTTPSPPSTATPPVTSSAPNVPSSPGPSSAGTPASAAPSNGVGKAAVAGVALAACVAALVL